MSSFSSICSFFMRLLMLLRSHVLSREAIVGKHPLSSPSLHHGIKSGNSRGCPGSASTTSIHGSKWSEQSTASGSKPTCRATLTSCLLLFLLLLLPLVQILGSLLQCLHPLEQPLGKDVARLSDLHHVVTRVFASSVAGLAQVVVITDNTLVPVSNNWLALTSITSDSIVNSSRCSRSLLLLLLNHRLGLLDVDLQLVEWPGHLSQGDDELLVTGDGHIVPIIISPGHGEGRGLDLGEHDLQLANQVVIAGAGPLVDDKPSHLLLPFASFHIDFERYVISHCCSILQLTCGILVQLCSISANAGPQLRVSWPRF